MTSEPTQHRIGAVSALSGVPVPTLRVWESRYGAFTPAKTGGRHRLYTEADVLRGNAALALDPDNPRFGPTMK